MADRGIQRYSSPNVHKGFTLVELSIVLVIIGLLIGGILVAQSMISTARIQAITRQLSHFDIAVANFQTRYNQLPGDSSLFTPQGDNNGFIGTTAEAGAFWAHLSLGVGLNNAENNPYQVFDPVNDNITKLMCPQFNINQNMNTLPCLQSASAQYNGITKNYYFYSNWDGGGGSTWDPLYTADMLSLDLKMDDGLPLSSKVRSNTLGANTTSQCIIQISGTWVYDTANTEYACTGTFLIGLNN